MYMINYTTQLVIQASQKYHKVINMVTDIKIYSVHGMNLTECMSVTVLL